MTRNPYVLLGVPFGASSDVATAAFARRARGLRRAADGTERLRDLTWALNQIQEALRNPQLALEIFRVPADAGALEPDGDGVLRPGPERMPRRTVAEGHWPALLASAAEEACRALRADVSSHADLPTR